MIVLNLTSSGVLVLVLERFLLVTSMECDISPFLGDFFFFILGDNQSFGYYYHYSRVIVDSGCTYRTVCDSVIAPSVVAEIRIDNCASATAQCLITTSGHNYSGFD